MSVILGIGYYLLGKQQRVPVVASASQMLIKGANGRFKTAVVSGRGGVPQLENVQTIRAEKTLKTLQSGELAPFVMPASSHEQVLKFFGKCYLDGAPDFSAQEVLSLLLTCKDGSKSRICVYEIDLPEQIYFSVNGTRCYSAAESTPTASSLERLLELVEREAELAAK